MVSFVKSRVTEKAPSQTVSKNATMRVSTQETYLKQEQFIKSKVNTNHKTNNSNDAVSHTWALLYSKSVKAAQDNC